MSKFKVGDRVRIVNSRNRCGKEFIGDVVTIDQLTRANIDNERCYHVTGRAGEHYVWFDDELELVKPKFDIKDYPDNYVMYCKSEEGAKTFLEYLDSTGKCWASGGSLLNRTYFNRHREMYYRWHGDRVVYGYGPVDMEDGHVLKFEDFDWGDFTMKKKFTMKKEFTKADLKNGDVIKRRDGSVEIVCVDVGTCICQTGNHYDRLIDLNDDLTHVDNRDDDIIAVRRPLQPRHCCFDAFALDLGELVYERKEVEEMTLEEVCKALGKEIKIVKK